jgi:soluble lytic murein transglycosylase-like protein
MGALGLIGLIGLGGAGACATAQTSRAPVVQASTPEPASPSEATSEPAPLVEISPEAMVVPPPEPRAPAPFDAKQLARIVAVQDIVAAAAAAHEVDPALINGLIWVESKFEPRARGPAGAQGLMQLMPNTAGAMAKQLGRKRASYDPDFNIHAGTLLLARLLRRFDGDVALALAAYNRGSGIVAGWVAAGEPLPERTQAFVDRVLTAREWFVEPLPVLESAAIASN